MPIPAIPNSVAVDKRKPGRLQFIGPTHTPFLPGTAINATARQTMTRVVLITQQDLLELRLPVFNWYVTGSGTLVTAAKDYILTAAIEVLEATGVRSIAILFGGASSITINASSAVMTLSDDWVATNGQIKAGHFALKVEINTATAGIPLGFALANPSAGPYAGFTYVYAAPLGSLTPLLGTGAMLSTGQAGGGQIMPAFLQGMLGRFKYLAPALMIIGDSQVAGNGLLDPYAGAGGFSRMAQQVGAVLLNFGISNIQAQAWAALPSYVFAMAAYMTDVTIEPGVNDLTAGQTATQIQTSVSTIRTKVLANPIDSLTHLWGCTITPKVTATAITTISNITTITNPNTGTATMAEVTVADITKIPAPGEYIQITGMTGTSLAYTGVFAVYDIDTANSRFHFVYAGGATGFVGTPVLTDACSTPGNQTDAFPVHRPAFNTWVKSQKGSLFYGIYDRNVVSEYGGSGASGLWVKRGTNDLLHPTDIQYVSEGMELARQHIAQGGPYYTLPTT